MRYLSDCICEVCLLLQSNNNKNKYILNKLNKIIIFNVVYIINIFYFQKKFIYIKRINHKNLFKN